MQAPHSRRWADLCDADESDDEQDQAGSWLELQFLARVHRVRGTILVRASQGVPDQAERFSIPGSGFFAGLVDGAFSKSTFLSYLFSWSETLQKIACFNLQVRP